MSIKNALAIMAATSVILAVLSGLSAMAFGSEQPPLKGLFRGNFTLLDSPAPASQTPFQDAAGRPVTMADFAGRVVLLNFWATWCPPCIRELPALDRLQGELDAEGLSVVAISWDRGGLAVVAPFLEELGTEHLAIYLDPKGTTGKEFGVRGLPTTLLVDAEGRIVGGLEGPAEWDSPEAVELIRYYLDKARRSAGPVKAGGG